MQFISKKINIGLRCSFRLRLKNQFRYLTVQTAQDFNNNNNNDDTLLVTTSPEISPFLAVATSHPLSYSGLSPHFIRTPPQQFEDGVNQVESLSFKEMQLKIKQEFENNSKFTNKLAIRMLRIASSIEELEICIIVLRLIQKSSSIPLSIGVGPTLLIQGLVHFNQPLRAVEIIKDKPQYGLFVNSISYAVLIDSLLKSEQYDTALDVYYTMALEELNRQSCQILRGVSAIAHACDSSQLMLLETSRQLSELVSWQYIGDVLWNVLQVLLMKNKFNQALNILHEMEKKDSYNKSNEICIIEQKLISYASLE